MQFIFDGEFYKVAKITGPKHNMLGVRFSDIDEEIDVINLDTSVKQKNLSAREIKKQVKLGLTEINRELGTNYKISAIQFIDSDSESDSIYSELVKEIIKNLESSRKFAKTSNLG